MEFRLPEEVWSSKAVKFSYLKVFGCVSYVHVDSDARSKFGAKSKICFSLAMVMRNLAMVMRNLAIGFGMNKTGKSLEVQM